jgi:hypothetical protein
MRGEEPIRAAIAALESVATEAQPLTLPTLLGELERVRAIAWARLTVPVPSATNGRPEQDVVDDVHEVARIVRRSVSWVRKRGHTLPGFQQPGGKGCKVAWSRQALEAWAMSPS